MFKEMLAGEHLVFDFTTLDEKFIQIPKVKNGGGQCGGEIDTYLDYSDLIEVSIDKH